MALTINFTGEKKASTVQIGYFPKIADMTRGTKTFLRFLLQDILVLPSATSTDNKRRFFEEKDNPPGNLVIYYPNGAQIEQQITWNFSDTSEKIVIDTYYVPQLRSHRFYDDIVNLGGGNDRLDFWIDNESTERPYNALLYLSYRDEQLDRGSTLVINGGSGNDYINIQGISEDFTINKIGEETGYLKAPVVRINGDAGNDRIYVYHHAGIIHGDTPLKSGTTGADRIEMDVFSDYINGGAGPDIITPSRTWYFDSLNDFKETEKDFLLGGTGKDTFKLGFSYELNGQEDFAYIADFETSDRITTGHYSGDLLIDPKPGSLALLKTETYAAQTVA